MLLSDILVAWDLLKIDFYGFQAPCEDFFRHHSNHFVSPLRISGSAVETLFSQYKYAAGGKLDSANYSTVRAVCMVCSIVTPHPSGKGYKDASISSIGKQIVQSLSKVTFVYYVSTCVYYDIVMTKLGVHVHVCNL